MLIASTTTAVALATTPALAAPAGSTHYPDLQTVIPTNSFSIVNGASGREFRYTHLVYNAGPGPLAVQPQYSEASGNYQGQQQLFTHNAAGVWSMVSQRKVPDAFVFHAAHGHFHFPLASFGLYAVAADGGPGAPVTMSPKNGFCIADSYIYDSSVAHAGQFPGGIGSCADPLSMRGMSVGAADEYDYRDPGQAIPFDGVPDGTYWFRAITDPSNDFQEADESNNEQDVLVTIANGKVTAGEVRHPDTTPPSIAVKLPLNGARVSGTVPLSADAAGGQTVQFLLDGNVIGSSTDTAAPYGLAWDSTRVVDGDHWLAARTVDARGRTNTSEVTLITVANIAPPPVTGALTIDGSTSQDAGGTVTTAPFSTLKSGDMLVAFVASDGPNGASQQTVTVTGGGLQWTLVRRANGRAGTSEIWKAVAPGPLTGLQVTSTQAKAGYHQSIHLVAFANAGGIGASNGVSATSGAPAVSLTTTRPGSWVWGVGNDWDSATPRTVVAGQSLVHQWVDTGVGDTFWMQNQVAVTPAAGTAVAISDSKPTTDQFNLASVEILSGAPFEPPPADTTPPQVRISEPVANATLSGITQIGAVASDDVGVAKVQFKLDGQTLGSPVTAPPFAMAWDTRTASQGQHTLTAEAYDAAGNVAASAGQVVTVDNSAPGPGAITIDTSVSRQAKGALASPGLTTSAPGEQIVAFVAMDGPNASAAQRSTVTGGGLTWTLVKRSDTQAGVAEVWSATANTVLTNAVITAAPLRTGFDGLLHVVAFNGALGTGVAGAAGAGSGAPDIYLPGVRAGSWVFAVGNDWDRAVARTPATGQVVQRQWIDTGAGDTFWVQSTAAPNTAMGLVTIHDNAPTNDRWNYAAVELVAAPAAGGNSLAFASSSRVAVSFTSATRANRTGHASLVGGLCTLGSAGLLPPAADVIATATRNSAVRKAGTAAIRSRHPQTVRRNR
ncbi:Ig-like domain-containing protein [Solirubrobacter ginsenosidimutans]|uniref:Ig-like domain-containing protein n=1 Tax=Solirubrobacter ginsenosidimutans TaxID=490573 RepID=A0A9X3N1N6_9ACTN|nr:Ig-like domain-containing protein [Solirubrobacter ginsenosidimutans]